MCTACTNTWISQHLKLSNCKRGLLAASLAGIHPAIHPPSSPSIRIYPHTMYI